MSRQNELILQIKNELSQVMSNRGRIVRTRRIVSCIKQDHEIILQYPENSIDYNCKKNQWPGTVCSLMHFALEPQGEPRGHVRSDFPGESEGWLSSSRKKVNDHYEKVRTVTSLEQFKYPAIGPWWKCNLKRRMHWRYHKPMRWSMHWSAPPQWFQNLMVLLQVWRCRSRFQVICHRR